VQAEIRRNVWNESVGEQWIDVSAPFRLHAAPAAMAPTVKGTLARKKINTYIRFRRIK